MDWSAILRGAAMCALLIVAIGAQNAFVLSQGLRRRHVLPIVLTCALSDALLISAGIAGAGALIGGRPGALAAIAWAGAAYLAWFGFSALRRSLRGGAGGLTSQDAGATSLGRTLLTTVALTYLNPHVYLDTVVLLGSVGAREVGLSRVAFAAGAAATSCAWFFALGFGARLLSPLFARPASWRILDGLIGLMALGLSASLVFSAVQPGQGGAHQARTGERQKAHHADRGALYRAGRGG
jgi:L-lysine exporter family protein LysE/ArgO